MLLWLPLILILAILLYFSFLNFTGGPPENLGVHKGKLKDVPASPNCVSSFANTQDSVHYIEPLEVKSPEDLSKIKEIVLSSPLNKLITEKENYLYFESRTMFFRFTDDLEIYIDTESKLIHFRSASRVGHSDFGCNRKRVEAIKKDLLSHQ